MRSRGLNELAQRPNRWLLVDAESLSGIVKYQFNVPRVINPRDRGASKAESVIGVDPMDQIIARARRALVRDFNIGTASSPRRDNCLHLPYNPRDSTKEIPLEKPNRNLPKRLPIIKRTRMIRPYTQTRIVRLSPVTTRAM